MISCCFHTLRHCIKVNLYMFCKDHENHAQLHRFLVLAINQRCFYRFVGLATPWCSSARLLLPAPVRKVSPAGGNEFLLICCGLVHGLLPMVSPFAGTIVSTCCVDSRCAFMHARECPVSSWRSLCRMIGDAETPGICCCAFDICCSMSC